ncbi:hypothetical protein SBRY_50589 [Actinacidiphila bryophytorum]|uniref:Uncharacterized protein n=1 Tax=Actinacidiphila bryophytorum TaxID=1436133 RepID=A0A9W4H549_9ACTN|nr:hypothetical protein SBRY_50589 [Actinacidiphila bryophytorum]
MVFRGRGHPAVRPGWRHIPHPGRPPRHPGPLMEAPDVRSHRPLRARHTVLDRPHGPRPASRAGLLQGPVRLAGRGRT